MDIYVASLTLFILLLIAAVYWEFHQDNGRESPADTEEVHQLQILDDEIHDIDRETTADRYHDFRSQFLTIYGLVVAADWLQVMNTHQNNFLLSNY